MKRVNRPYLLDTETLSAWYETLLEANQQFDYWADFYNENKGKYGENRTITIIYRTRKADRIVRQVTII